MPNEPGIWQNTTHDWAMEVDVGHRWGIRCDPTFDSRNRDLHLVLEVLA